MSAQTTSDIISVGWEIENQLLKILIGGASETHTQTLSDNAHYDDVVIGYLDNATQPIHIIVHLQPVLSNPPVSSLLKLKHPRHPRTGYIVVVNASTTPIARFFISIVSSMSGVKLKSAVSMDEALAMLKTLTHTLEA